jgi:hypothetical protein
MGKWKTLQWANEKHYNILTDKALTMFSDMYAVDILTNKNLVEWFVTYIISALTIFVSLVKQWLLSALWTIVCHFVPYF